MMRLGFIVANPWPYRYWKFDTFASVSGPQLGELEVSDATGAVQTQATASASPAVQNGPVSKINDGTLNDDIYWSVYSDANTIFYDFGLNNNKNLIAMRLGLKFNAGANYFPTQVKVWYSTDGLSYTLKKTVTGIVYPGGGSYTPSLSLV